MGPTRPKGRSTIRVLVAGLSDSRSICLFLVDQGFEVATLQPSSVDLGDFGGKRLPPNTRLPYRLELAPVFPTRPYPYSLYLGGAASLLRDFRPELLYLIGEPSELGVAQLVRLSRRFSPATRLVLYSFENVEQRWHGFPRCLRAWAQRRTLPSLDLVAAASEGARQCLLRRGLAADRIRLLPRGSDENFYYRREASSWRAELRIAPEDFLIGYVGRLVYEKGVDLLLEALHSLSERFVLALAGRGRYEAELRALAGRLNLDSRLRWLGRLAGEQVPLLLSACQALVLPSRSIPTWQEQFGLVLVEAMLCETPVIGSSSGAIPEVIGDAGLIFPEGEVPALADCLARLAADPQLRADLAASGKRRALDHFTTRLYLERVASLIREAAALPRRNDR